MSRVFERWSSEKVLRAIIWLGTWYLTWKLAFPLLDWPFADRLQASAATVTYAGSSIIVPLLIGALTTTQNNDFWQSKQLANSPILRFYTHLGALLGFHIGYFIVFSFGLLAYYFKFVLAPGLATMTGAVLPLVLAAAAARQVPLDLWQAYDDLRFKYGGIFSIFLLLGPAWGAFFYAYFPYILAPAIGVPLLLLSISSLALLLTWQHKVGNAIIPAHVWTGIFGAIWILYQVSHGESIFGIVVSTSLLVALISLWAQGRMHITLKGGIAFFIASGMLIVAFYLDDWVGRIATVIAVLIWWLKGKVYLWPSATFWVVIAAIIVVALFIQYNLLEEVQAAMALGLITAGILWLNSLLIRKRHLDTSDNH